MLIIATYLSHNNDFFTSETRIFCFHCKRKVCESHEVTISFSCTLTYTFAIISAQGPPWMRTQASFSIILRCDFLYTSCLCCDGDEPRRFFAGTISTHSNSTRIILTLFVFNTAKHIAIGISKSLRTTCPGRPSLCPSPSNHPGLCEYLVLSQWPYQRCLLFFMLQNSANYLEALTGERSERGFQDGGKDDEDTFAGLESRGMGGRG